MAPNTSAKPAVAPLLSLHQITKRYPAIIANDSISLDVEAGSIHAILGENGAGKSTLVKLVYGSGHISWQGERVDLRSTAAARKLGIGMVFQHFSLFETLSVVENISLTLPGSRASLSKRIREMGERYQLIVNPEASVHSLSVGERQRVEIIRCLMQDLKLLILDEPTSVLPPQHISSLFDALRKLRDSGVAILFISHKLEEIRQLCDQATILRSGKVASTVNPANSSATELATLMIGHDVPAVSTRATQTIADKPQLEVNSVSSKSLDPFGTSLNNIQLQVHGGEIVGIAGVSGNGQQELSRLLSGERIDSQLRSGAIRMMGNDVTHMGAADRRDLGFSFVPEERLGRGAVPSMTLSKNTLLTAYSKGLLKNGFLRKKQIRNYTQECITDFDVRCGGSESTANSLSGGGIAILIISEEIEELFEITDRLHVMNRGSLSPPLITAEVTPNDVGEYMIGTQSSHSSQTDTSHAN